MTSQNTFKNIANNIINSPVVNSTKKIANTAFSYVILKLNQFGLGFRILLVLFLLITIYILYVTFIEKVYIQKKETYYVDGRYTFNEAKNVCKSINSRIATVKELYKNYDLGANWCKYGWLEAQIVAYPNQIKTTFCGKSGVNGNYQDDKNKNYGVVCIGVKPNVIMEKDEKKYEIGDVYDKISPFSETYWSYNDMIADNK